MSAQEDFFGARLPNVEQPLIWLYRTYGALEWMRGCSKVGDLPGYDARVCGNENRLILNRADAEWKTVYWLCQNDFDGWCVHRELLGSQMIYHFFFRDEGDLSLARLAT